MTQSRTKGKYQQLRNSSMHLAGSLQKNNALVLQLVKPTGIPFSWLFFCST